MIFSVLMMLSLAGADGFGYFDPESMDDCSSYHDWQSCVTRGGTYDIGDDPSLTPHCYWQWGYGDSTSGYAYGSGLDIADGENAFCSSEDVCPSLGGGDRDDQYYMEYEAGCGQNGHHDSTFANCRFEYDRYYWNTDNLAYYNYEGDGCVADLCQYLTNYDDCSACAGDGWSDITSANHECKLGNTNDLLIFCNWQDMPFQICYGN